MKKMSARILPMSIMMAQGNCGGHHISEEDMDFYVRACPPGIPTLERNPRIDAIEEHLLICEPCQNDLQKLDDLCSALTGSDSLTSVGSAIKRRPI
jgi:hypothetical protein